MCAVGKIKLELWGLKKSSKLKLPETSSFKTFQSHSFILLIHVCEHEGFWRFLKNHFNYYVYHNYCAALNRPIYPPQLGSRVCVCVCVLQEGEGCVCVCVWGVMVGFQVRLFSGKYGARVEFLEVREGSNQNIPLWERIHGYFKLEYSTFL